MGIIGVLYSSNTRTVDQPIYITCRTRKRLLGACADRRVHQLFKIPANRTRQTTMQGENMVQEHKT